MDVSGYREYHLKAGYIFFTTDPTIIMTVLGTSVAVALYDRNGQVGGMNHFVYPWMQAEIQPTAIYARPAVVQLLRMFHSLGTPLGELEAHIIGGGVPDGADEEIARTARNNVEAAAHLLEQYQIPIAGQEVGGRHGRKVLFNTSTGELVIAKVERIRKGDWFPFDPSFEREEEE